MLNRLICAFFVLLLTNIGEKASAFAMPPSKPLSQTIAQSQIVVVVSLVKYQSEKSLIQSKDQEPPPTGATGSDTLTNMPMKPAGRYVLHVIKCIKGTAPPTLHVDLPYILVYYYGVADLPIQNGSKLILFLQAGADGNLTPTDATVPFVPLTDEAAASGSHLGSAEENVFSLMLASCSSAKIRQANTYLLRNTVNPSIVAGLFPYINDPDSDTRGYVLTCMAANQQVSAIPRIAALEEQGSGSDAVTALGHFETPQALLYLNPLLFSSAYYVRLNAIFSIDNLADHTSLPYLMLAIRDPDYQNVIPQSAYGILHHLNPALGEAFGNDYFAQHRAAETKKLYAWWSDELLGKHLKPGEHPAIPAIIPDTPAQLNPLLFIPDAATRQAVAAKLAQSGNASSIPYLVLALQDPDSEVAFSAYKTLHRLIPALGSPRSLADFTASPAAISQPIYDWWRDELLGKHQPK
jgi:HEAT repeat protein